MSAEIDLGSRCKPPEVESIRAPYQESGLCEIHLERNLLHPVGVAGGRQHTHGSGVTGEGPVRERIDLAETLSHA
jgi:hypothetical protein